MATPVAGFLGDEAQNLNPWGQYELSSPPFQSTVSADAFSPVGEVDLSMSQQQITPSTPWKPPMTSYNSCPNLTHALRDTSLTNVYSTPFEDSRCTTPQQPNNSSHDLNDTVHGVDSTPTTLSARSVVADQTAVTDSSQTMNRSLSEGRALEKPVPAVLPTGSAGNPTVSPFAMKPFTSTHSPTKKSHTGSNTADANIALRQSAFSRSASEYSIASAAGATPHHDSLVSSQSSISPASGLDRSASSTSLASSFSSCMAGDEASRSSPPTSDHVPSPASSQTPAVVSLIRQNSGSVNSTGRTTRSRTSASFSMGKPRRSGKLTDLDRKRICEFHRDHPSANQDTVGLRFGVERSTVSKTLKEKARWLAVPEDPEATLMSRSDSKRRTGNSHSSLSRPSSPSQLSLSLDKAWAPSAAITNRSCRFPEVEASVIDWARNMSRQGDYLADQAIRDQARFIANSQGITDQQFKASQGWLERFKVRAGISGGRVLEDDPHLDDERGFTEAAFPLPSPQEPLSSSSSSSTGSFFDESDTAMLHQAHRRSDSSVSLAPSSLSGSQASSYLASQSDAARRFPTQQMHDQFASQPGSTALAQYQHQDPNTPLTSPDYPITSRIHQRTQSGVPSQVDSSLISPPFSALSDQARPGHFDAQQRAFMSRRATISAFSAEPQQQQRLAFDPSCAPQPLHVTLPQAQQASSVLAQFIQQQQGLVPPDIHHVILSLQYFLHQQQSQTEQFQADQYNLNTGMPVELMAPMPHKPIDTSMVPLSEAMVSGTTSQQQQAYPLQTHQLHPPPQAF